MNKTAIVAGATGLVGACLLDQLLAGRDYSRIKVLTRQPLDRKDARLENIVTDFSDLDALAGALQGDDVFCALGTTLRKAGSKAAFEKVDYHMVVGLARATQKAGARKFIVVSSVGSSIRSPAFYSRVKARMEEAVAGAGFEAVHILRPSLLLGARREFRPGEQIAQWLAPVLAPLFVGPLRPYQPIAAAAVAAAMRACAADPARGVQIHALPRA